MRPPLVSSRLRLGKRKTGFRRGGTRRLFRSARLETASSCAACERLARMSEGWQPAASARGRKGEVAGNIMGGPGEKEGGRRECGGGGGQEEGGSREQGKVKRQKSGGKRRVAKGVSEGREDLDSVLDATIGELEDREAVVPAANHHCTLSLHRRGRVAQHLSHIACPRQRRRKP
eukprot:3230367-Rhodomonas_salina.1